MLMTFEQLKRSATQDIVSTLSEEWEVKEISVQKHNREGLTGLTFMQKGSNGGPTIYAENIYDLYMHGVPYEELIKGLTKSIEDSCKIYRQLQGFFEELTFEKVKANLRLRICDKKINEELLKPLVYREIGGGIVITVDINYESATARVTRDHLDMLGVTEDDLFKEAMSYQVNAAEPVLVPIEEAMTFGGPKEASQRIGNFLQQEAPLNPDQLLVLTNTNDLNGAVALSYPGILEKITDLMGGDFFILPSSIHEVLIIGTGKRGRAAKLQETIHSANSNVVSADEILSDSLFICKNGKLERVPSKTGGEAWSASRICFPQM